MSINTYSYNNIFVPTREVLREDTFYYNIPRQLSERCVQEKPSCFNANGSPLLANVNSIKKDPFSTPIVFRTIQGEYPDIPKNKTVLATDALPHGKKETYIHMYGRLHFFYLAFKDPEEGPKKFLRVTQLEQFFTQIVGATKGPTGIIAAKLVYKKPPNAACLGPQYLLKVYLGGTRFITPPDFLKALSKCKDNPFVEECINSKIPLHSQWITAKEATPMGQLTIGCSYSTSSDQKDNFKYMSTHYNDVEPYTGFCYEFDEEQSNHRIDAILEAIAQIRMKCNTKEARKMFAHRIKDLVKSIDTLSKWTYKHLIGCFLDPLLTNVKETHKSHILSHLFVQYSGKHTPVSWSRERYDLFVLDCIMFRDCVRSFLKEYWAEQIVGKSVSKDTQRVDDIHVRITKYQRILTFDLETSYVPHTKDKQYITCIASTLADQGAYAVPYEHRIFVLISPERIQERITYNGLSPDDPDYCDEDKIIRDAVKQMSGGKGILNGNLNLTKDSLRVYTFTDYKDMLTAFVEYARSTRATIISGFNILSFDIPKLITELESVNFEDMRDRQTKRIEGRRVSYPFSFSYRKDSIEIKYALKKNKNADKNSARLLYQENAISAYKQGQHHSAHDKVDMKNVIESQITKDNDENQEESFPTDLPNDDFMIQARNIIDLSSCDTSFWDAMVECAGVGRYITLNTCLKNELGLMKTQEEDERVSYTQITETWKRGDLPLVLRYCLTDAMGTSALLQVLDRHLYYMGCSAIASLPTRELYGREMVTSTLCSRQRHAFWRSILEIGHKPKRDKSKTFMPDYEYDDEDFDLLTARAGRTVDYTTGFYNRFHIPVVDFSSQYVRIMMGYNTCPSAMMTEAQLQGLDPELYHRITVCHI